MTQKIHQTNLHHDVSSLISFVTGCLLLTGSTFLLITVSDDRGLLTLVRRVLCHQALVQCLLSVLLIVDVLHVISSIQQDYRVCHRITIAIWIMEDVARGGLLLQALAALALQTSPQWIDAVMKVRAVCLTQKASLPLPPTHSRSSVLLQLLRTSKMLQAVVMVTVWAVPACYESSLACWLWQMVIQKVGNHEICDVISQYNALARLLWDFPISLLIASLCLFCLFWKRSMSVWPRIDNNSDSHSFKVRVRWQVRTLLWTCGVVLAATLPQLAVNTALLTLNGESRALVEKWYINSTQITHLGYLILIVVLPVRQPSLRNQFRKMVCHKCLLYQDNDFSRHVPSTYDIVTGHEHLSQESSMAVQELRNKEKMRRHRTVVTDT